MKSITNGVFSQSQKVTQHDKHNEIQHTQSLWQAKAFSI